MVSTVVHGVQVVGGMQKNTRHVERVVGFMVSTTTGTGGGKGQMCLTLFKVSFKIIILTFQTAY